MKKNHLIVFFICVGIILVIVIFALARKLSEINMYKIIPYNNEAVLLLNTRSGETKLIRNKNSNIELEIIDIHENPYINNKLTKEYFALDEKVTNEFLKELKNSDNKEESDDNESPYDMQEELNQSIPLRFRH